MKGKERYDLESRVAYLRETEPFSYLDKQVLQKVAESLQEGYYPRETDIVKQDEASQHALFLVIEGKVAIFVRDSSGKETITGYRVPFDFFGETAFLLDERYPGSARALEDTYCFLLPQKMFEELVAENPVFGVFTTRLLTDRLRILYQKFSFYEEEDEMGGEALNQLISDIMVDKVVTCKPEDGMKEIASAMHKSDVSSVVVLERGKPVGIITEGDLVAKIAQAEDLQENISLTAREIMSAGLITVKPQDFSYRAFLLMVKHRIKHVVVVDNDGKLAGIAALRDVVKSRKTGSLAIVNSIESSITIDDVVKLQPQIDQVLQALLLERATVTEINSLVTEFYDRITRKIIKICEFQMSEEGYGPPPVGYCWITMGSSGRKEQYARTDQDNGIIYENVAAEKEKEVKDYFLIFGEKVVSGLERFGFKRCDGDVMANNAQWCRSFQDWRNTIRKWINDLDPQNVRLMTIFLDFRYIYGREDLHDLLRNFVVRNFRDFMVVLSYLVQDNLSKKVPINIFRQIQTERSGEHRHQINLKTAACVHVVDCLRVFSLREGVPVTNTFERLAEMGKRHIFSKKDTEFITAAYETLMMFRIRNAISQMRKGIEPDNYIDPRNLTNREQSLLREALVMVSRLQNITGKYFRYYLG